MNIGKMMARTAWVAGWLGAIAAQAAAAAPPPEVVQFEAAMAQENVSEAAEAYQQLMLARVAADGKPIADATLDAMAGRLSLYEGDPNAAVEFLKLDAKGDETDPVARAIDLAKAHLALGQSREAEAVFARISGAPSRQQAVVIALGRAAALVARDPAGAAQLVAPVLQQNHPSAWRAHFIVAQSELIRGNVPAARRAADMASLAAIDAPVGDYALLLTMQLRTAIAAQQSDRDRVAALLAAVPSILERTADFARRFTQLAPQCGIDGVREGDTVIAGALPELPGTLARPIILGASRPEIAPVYERALAGTLFAGGTVTLAIGPLVSLQCRNAPATSVAPPAGAGFIAALFARNHVRPLFLFEAANKSEDWLTNAAIRLEKFETKAGTESLVVAPGYFEIANLFGSRASESTDAVNAAARYMERWFSALGKLTPIKGFPIKYFVAPTDYLKMTRDQRVATVTGNFVGASEEVIYDLLARLMSNNNPYSAAERLTIIDSGLQQLPRGSKDPRQLPLMAVKLNLLREVSPDKMAGVLAANGLDPQLCDFRTAIANVKESNFSDSSYPANAIKAEIMGATMIESDIDATGKVTRSRVTVQSPPLIFDPALNAGLPSLVYSPARDGKDRAVGCRAKRQLVNWRLPGGSEPSQAEPLSEAEPGT